MLLKVDNLPKAGLWACLQHGCDLVLSARLVKIIGTGAGGQLLKLARQARQNLEAEFGSEALLLEERPQRAGEGPEPDGRP